LNKTLNQIAEIVNGIVEGDGDTVITGLSGVREARPGSLTFIADEKYLPLLAESKASALVVSKTLEVKGFPLVRVDDPGRAWGDLLELIKPPAMSIPKGVDPSAVIGEDVTLGGDASVMAGAVVMKGAAVGDGTVLYPNTFIGHDVRIGRDCLIYPGAVIRERVIVGDRVTIQPGAVIGSDGFGYEMKEGRLVKQEQFGTVVIEDDVEIGANVTIDRARFYETRIGRGTKIDNLAQLAHNVVVGEGGIIVSQVGIAGSARLGKRVTLAGQSGVAGHITIGDNAVVGARAGVTKDLPANSVSYGNPAGDRIKKQREIVSLRKVPELLEIVRELKERIARLEAQSKDD